MPRRKVLMRGPVEAIYLHPIHLYIRWRRGERCHHCGCPPEKIREPHECFACNSIIDYMDNQAERERQAVRDAEEFHDRMVARYEAVWKEREEGKTPGMTEAVASMTHGEAADWQARLMLIMTRPENGDPFEDGSLASLAWTVCQELGATGRFLLTCRTDETKPTWGPKPLAGRE